MPEEDENTMEFKTVAPTEPEPIPEPEPVSKPVSRTAKRTTTKVRTYAELADVTPNKMTEKELKICVENLRAELTLMSNKNIMLDENAKKAYEQCRQFQVAMQHKEAEYNNTIAFINQSTSVFARGVLLATQKGDK